MQHLEIEQMPLKEVEDTCKILICLMILKKLVLLNLNGKGEIMTDEQRKKLMIKMYMMILMFRMQIVEILL